MPYTRIPPPTELDSEDKRAIGQWVLNTYPWLRPRLAELWMDCRSYYEMQGEDGHQFNWPACFRRWIIREARGPWREKDYQEARPHKKAELALVRNIFSKVGEQ